MKLNNDLIVTGSCDGIGGMAKGCHNAGFKEKFLSDWWVKTKLVHDANIVRNDLEQNDQCISRGVFAAGEEGDLYNIDLEHINRILVREGEPTIKRGEVACHISGSVCKDMSGVNAAKRHAFGKFNYLMLEQVRLIKDLMPMTSICEQVPGFNDAPILPFRNEFYAYCKILEEDYHITCFKMNAKFYGSRQDRERLIFMFVRKDLGTLPSIPTPFTVDKSQYVSSLLPDIKGYSNGKKFVSADRIFGTMTSGDIKVMTQDHKMRSMTTHERKVLCNLENLNTDIPSVNKGELAEMMGNMVQIPFMTEIMKHVRTNILRA